VNFSSSSESDSTAGSFNSSTFFLTLADLAYLPYFVVLEVEFLLLFMSFLVVDVSVSPAVLSRLSFFHLRPSVSFKIALVAWPKL
jgi:hypothetical protein